MRKRLVPLAFVACCLPLPYLGFQFWRGDLGADPISKLLNDFGYTAFVLLAATLACTPAQLVFKLKWPILLRKLLGDFCFFYASLHLLTYVIFDQGFALDDIVKDVLKHKFIFLGMATWLLMLPLAVTSTQGWQKRLGFRKWKRLHRVVYLCGGLASVHFLLRFKTPRLETLAWMAAVAVLLLVRLVDFLRKRGRVIHSA
jgi:sulfoxide reductase heme-binding subunit YedZ